MGSKWPWILPVGLLALVACSKSSGSGAAGSSPSSTSSTQGATYSSAQLGSYCLPDADAPKGLKADSRLPTILGLPITGYEMQGSSGFETSGPTSLPPSTLVWYESFHRSPGTAGSIYSMACEAYLFPDAAAASAAMPIVKGSIAAFNSSGSTAAKLKDLPDPGIGDESFAVDTGTAPSDAPSIVWRKGNLIVEIDAQNFPSGNAVKGTMTPAQLQALATTVSALSNAT